MPEETSARFHCGNLNSSAIIPTCVPELFHQSAIGSLNASTVIAMLAGGGAFTDDDDDGLAAAGRWTMGLPLMLLAPLSMACLNSSFTGNCTSQLLYVCVATMAMYCACARQ